MYAIFLQQVLNGNLKEFFTLSGRLGGEVDEQVSSKEYLVSLFHCSFLLQGKLVKQAFMEVKNILVLAAKHKPPAAVSMIYCPGSSN